MSAPEKQLLMAGQPGTGKTTFLSLLWLAIFWNRAPGMRLADYQDDRSYLNRIAGRLQHCDPALHTELGEDRDLALSLLLGDDDEPALLRIPDLSGETWRDATLDRQWPARVEEEVSRCRGLLLFLHARDMNAGAAIGEVNEVIEILGSDAGEQGDAGDVEGESEAPASSGGTSTETVGEVEPGAAQAPKPKHKPPTQVALVDALQLICDQRGPSRWRVAIVISAWDLAGPGMTPREFIARNLRLLVQYLEANEDSLEVRIFGLSAQGGDFKDPAVREELARTDTVERAIVQEALGANVGVHEIVAWALGRS